MTTYKGIAAVTQVLGYFLGTAVRNAVPEASVTLARPEEPPAGAADEPRLNIYLVQVVPDPTLRTQDLPTRNGAGQLIAVPQAPVDLRYLLSFFGASQKAHLMLGATELALRESPVFGATLITQALTNHVELRDSGLETQDPPVQIVPSTISLEDLSRFWSGFLQTPYTVSTVYEARPVILTSSLTPLASLPVRSASPRSATQPPQLDPLPTVTFDPGAPVAVTGTGIAAGQQLEVAGRWAPITADPPSGLQFALPPDLPAGPLAVRLGAAPPGDPPRPIPGSDPQILRIRPHVRSVTLDPDRARVTVDVQPRIEPGQHVALSLVATAPSTDGTLASVQLTTTPPAQRTELQFDTPRGLPAGQYLALIEVDGVASLPVYEGDRMTGPAVELG